MSLVGTWTEREARRFVFREALFRRRGESPIEAEKLAERLLQRDRDDDERRLCIECANVRPPYRCAVGDAAVRDVFQRCDRFSWERPS